MIMESCLLKHVAWKKWGTLDALHPHKGYRMLRFVLKLSVRMLASIGLLFAKHKRNWIEAMNSALELQVSVVWKIDTDISYVFNSQEL